MTTEGANELKVALKETDIDHRLGAFLGVGCLPHEMGCEINVLNPNTAAQRAGLRVNDVIVKYNDEKVTDFENLTRLIAQNREGDSVTVEILRGTQTLTKQVTLGAWD